jgi:hypothetical protein
MTEEQTELPDYLNGRNDSARIAELLKTDPDFAADAALLQALRGAVRAQAEAIDGGAGLDALRLRIAKPSPWRHVRRFLELISRPALAPAIMATLAVLCVVQGTLLWQSGPAPLGMMTDDAAPGALTWRGAPASAPKASLQVRFDDQATLAQIEAALELAQARIVSGPLVDRSYLLDAAAPAAAATRLRTSAVVREVRVLPAKQ